MKKIILFLLIITLISCERDDICIDPTTPKMIILFFDTVDTDQRKSVPNLKVEVESTNDFVEINQSITDSISIPLRVDVDFTKIRLTKNLGETSEKVDNFTISYNRNQVFVSRSCGFKTTYTDIPNPIDLTDQWIQNLTINNQNIIDETEKHISIFH
jgi:hypothetical protein